MFRGRPAPTARWWWASVVLASIILDSITLRRPGSLSVSVSVSITSSSSSAIISSSSRGYSIVGTFFLLSWRGALLRRWLSLWRGCLRGWTLPLRGLPRRCRWSRRSWSSRGVYRRWRPCRIKARWWNISIEKWRRRLIVIMRWRRPGSWWRYICVHRRWPVWW